jgi:signal transduction histidine kinase
VAGNEPAALVIATDITESLAAAADVKKRSDFEQQLIGIVSHDLRNPLQVVRLSAATALRHAGTAARERRPFERILASSDRALRMLDDLLDFTGIRVGGGVAIHASAGDLNLLASEVVEDVVVTRPERSVAIDTQGDCRGTWDADRLRQVLQNLVVNALQHTTEEIPVRVSTRAEDRHVICDVHNGGPAMSEETLAHLFEPFQRGARAGGSRGMGLGLYIARHIVQAHGGTLEVRSSSQEGTTFTVRLPRNASCEAQQGTKK